MKARSSLQWGLFFILTLVCLVFALAWTAGRAIVGEDDYGFVHGQSPFLTGVIPNFEDGGSSKGFTDEYRIYSWRANYHSVVREASHELADAGFRRLKDDFNGIASWKRADDGRMIEIEGRRSRDRHEALHGNSSSKSQWVTVTCSDPIPDTPWSHVRYALEPNDF
ncbi:MAG TPA: hypothetical protein VG944_17130 [Fimbriimonas sp.]|nr:hypothetical protein [Fimbriimonas sp.]